MCGRYALKTPTNIISQIFGAELLERVEINPHYNIAPTFQIPIVRYDSDKKERIIKRDYWGIVPYWAKNPKIAAYTSNARADGVAEKPSFKRAFEKMRCLVIMDGFYEWERSTKPSQPYYFSMKDQQPFACAGLYETWKVRWIEDESKKTTTPQKAVKPKKEPKPPKPIVWPINLGGKKYNQGDELESCTIITTEANSLMEKVHDRMPVILDPKDYDSWLNPAINDPGTLKALLKPFPASMMQCWPVSRNVNNVAKDDSENCIKKIE